MPLETNQLCNALETNRNNFRGPMYFRWGIVYIYPVIDKHTMILGIIFVLSAYVLSKTTPPPHCETWEEIQAKINNQPK